MRLAITVILMLTSVTAHADLYTFTLTGPATFLPTSSPAVSGTFTLTGQADWASFGSDPGYVFRTASATPPSYDGRITFSQVVTQSPFGADNPASGNLVFLYNGTESQFHFAAGSATNDFTLASSTLPPTWIGTFGNGTWTLNAAPTPFSVVVDSFNGSVLGPIFAATTIPRYFWNAAPTFTLAPVPEPGTLALIASAMLATLGIRQRAKSANEQAFS